MKRFNYTILLSLAIGFVMTSCFDDNDDIIHPATATDIGDFVWKGMNSYYLFFNHRFSPTPIFLFVFSA